jgi:hypothetical protein
MTHKSIEDRACTHINIHSYKHNCPYEVLRMYDKHI